MAVVLAQISNEFGPGPIEASVLRFVKKTSSVCCLGRQGKIKTDHLLNILFSSFYIMLIFFFLPISKILSLSMVLLALNA